MSDIIQLLPDSVANQIAAGEVIQRPASVIKELVENAVDANASTIHVLVTDSGRTAIQVIDDGKGMSETDARLSFERHATSKIRKADDLFALHTMGFRGEALASIAAVAQVELKTRMYDDELGTHLTIAGSKFQGQEPCSCPQGTNFLVENLFYNVPARRKFLKSNATELNNILTSFERIALVYPDIHFTLHSNDTEVFDLPKANLHKRIVDIFGKRIDKDLLPVDVDTTLCRLKGFVGKPESAKKKTPLQYFFVNGRYMKHAYFHKAVLTAFDRLIPVGTQVPYFLYFEVAPEDIDVNIHPTKTEIKFENEQAIWQMLMAAVKEAVGKFSNIPAIDFESEQQPEIPLFTDNPFSSAPQVEINTQYNPFTETPNPFQDASNPFLDPSSPTRQGASNVFPSSSPSFGESSPSFKESSLRQPAQPSVPSNWDSLYEGLGNGDKGVQSSQDIFQSAIDTQKPSTKPTIEDKAPTHYQYKGSYIMTSMKSGLMLIDQHRAHMRILYERYLQMLANRKSVTQRMLFPEMVTFPPAERPILPLVLPELEALGFEISQTDEATYSVNGVPSGLEGLNIPNLVQQMVANVDSQEVSLKEKVDQSLALTMASQAAIPQGQVLNNDEMETLVNDLFACENVNYTPDGKTIVAIIQQHDIEQMFS